MIDKQIGDLCKIYNVKNEYLGTGFLIKIPYPDQYSYLSVLISNKHIFIEEDLLENKLIRLNFKNDSIIINITITPERKIYKSQKNDIIIIEILKSDKINNFLDYEDKNSNFNKKDIYILQYKENKKGEAIYGKIIDVVDSEIRHNCKIEEGWDEGPILLLDNLKVIGIHQGRNKELNYYYGALLKDVIQEFNEIYQNEDNFRQNIDNERKKYEGNKRLNNIIPSIMKSIHIIFRECGKVKNNGFIIECPISAKLKDAILQYKDISKNNNSNIFKYNGDILYEYDFELSLNILGIENRHTIFVIQEKNNEDNK